MYILLQFSFDIGFVAINLFIILGLLSIPTYILRKYVLLFLFLQLAVFIKRKYITSKKNKNKTVFKNKILIIVSW